MGAESPGLISSRKLQRSPRALIGPTSSNSRTLCHITRKRVPPPRFIIIIVTVPRLPSANWIYTPPGDIICLLPHFKKKFSIILINHWDTHTTFVPAINKKSTTTCPQLVHHDQDTGQPHSLHARLGCVMVGPSKKMYLISKTGPRTNSRKGTPEYQSENTTNMDPIYSYAAGPPHMPKIIKRRESRIRSSFFGGGQAKRESYELSSEETEGMESPSRSMTSSSDDKENNMSFLSRRKLRKSSSHASLSSAAYAYENRQEKVGRKGFAELLRGAKTSPTRQPAGTKASSLFLVKPLLKEYVQVNGIIRSASHSISSMSHMATLSNSLACTRRTILHWFGTGTMLYGILQYLRDGTLSEGMSRQS